jgi:hypothetical protein
MTLRLIDVGSKYRIEGLAGAPGPALKGSKYPNWDTFFVDLFSSVKEYYISFIS